MGIVVSAASIGGPLLIKDLESPLKEVRARLPKSKGYYNLSGHFVPLYEEEEAPVVGKPELKKEPKKVNRAQGYKKPPPVLSPLVIKSNPRSI